MKFETTVIDDDGVAVIASPFALKQRYADRAFDYTFPNALLEGMNAHELFAWRTGFEGEHIISVEIVNAPPAERRRFRVSHFPLPNHHAAA